jgi:hypothetical protein
MGLAHILLALVAIAFYATTGTPLAGADIGAARTGAYAGYALILLFTGRTYYWRVLLLAAGLKRDRTAEEIPAVTAARLFLLCFVGFVGVQVVMGLDWLVALFFSLALMLLFLVFTRIICETGIPFMQPGWMPAGFLVSVFGPAAIGPGPLVYILYFGSMLCQDPRECLMPYVATGFKMADDNRLPLRRTYWVMAAAVVVALAVGFLSMFWTLYNFGGLSRDAYANKVVPTSTFDTAVRSFSEMTETGVFEESNAAGGLAKLRLWAPNTTDLGYMATGGLAVLVFAALRFRFTRFPLHPVLFIVWGTYPCYMAWASFLLGWGVKALVVRFGGGKVYQNLKPVFVGIIAGELIAAGLSIFIEMIFYWTTGRVPGTSFGILPG